MATHLAAVSLGKDQPFEVQTRATPKPGTGELLIAVKSVALNPADAIMRNTGFLVSQYPAVIGVDMAGLVLEIGEGVPTAADADAAADAQAPCYSPGITRVAAYAATIWKSCNPDYGAFQEMCIVPWQHAVPLPNSGMSWNHAATLPVSVEVPLNAWDDMGIPRMGTLGKIYASLPKNSASADTNTGEQEVGPKKGEALLVWGASSSVGTMAVQTGRLLQKDPASSFAAVYATCGWANKGYVTSLGADRVFDYKDPRVVEAIVSAAKEDGLVIRHCFLAVGALTACQAVLKEFLGDGQHSTTAKIGSAPPLPAGAEDVEGITTMFLQPSLVESERLEQYRYWMGTWLRTNLIKGTIKPSPEPTVVGKGVGAINTAVDRMSRGVSCTKLIVEVAE